VQQKAKPSNAAGCMASGHTSVLRMQEGAWGQSSHCHPRAVVATVVLGVSSCLRAPTGPALG